MSYIEPDVNRAVHIKHPEHLEHPELNNKNPYCFAHEMQHRERRICKTVETSEAGVDAVEW